MCKALGNKRLLTKQKPYTKSRTEIPQILLNRSTIPQLKYLTFSPKS